MLIHNLEQGTLEWMAARLGIPTASSFDKLITPTGKPSTQTESYFEKLLAERLTGECAEYYTNEAMERGKDMEPNARAWYELETGATVEQVGFVTDDSGRYGCSPDGLVGDDGLVEIKCPLPHNHVRNMRSTDIDTKYYPQVQGQLWVTGRAWCDWLSYHDKMNPVLIRVQRDDSYIEIMAALVMDFCDKLDAEEARLR